MKHALRRTAYTGPHWLRERGRSSPRAVGVAVVVVLALVGCQADDSSTDPSRTAERDRPAAKDWPAGKDRPAATDRPAAKERPAGKDRPAEPAPVGDRPGAGTALAALSTLDVKGRAPTTGYDRDEFGPEWTDRDHNGCDTRNDILRRDLERLVLEAGTSGCVVLAGRLRDPFTGTAIRFVQGETTSTAVQVDHVVALSDAWQKGAQRWTPDTREAFANDPLGLLAVDGLSNASKGDGDAATWLPPNRSYWCSYVARQVTVKGAYDLWVTGAERDAMERVLQGCPGQRLARPGRIELGGGRERSATPTTTPPPAPPSGDVYYENCDAARAVGAAPVYRGDPGYGTHLDADGDGVGCE
ncbi:MAG: excalibur calcium-binding domain-containing protein [Actinomycetota bacterium]|nr:excalibur calcium-binding domain-containing protein [Actinomycetota bacterium]